MKIFKKAILPKGFKANGLACGIKRSGKLDLALFCSQVNAKASCLFTTNSMLAAPLKLAKAYLKKNKDFGAIIVNSGNANCFTGNAGLKDAEVTAEALAKELGIKKESVLVSSTGIIARRLPVEKIKKAIPGLVSDLSEKGIDKAKLAILTTDLFVKEITVKFSVGNRLITICGVAKGAGMIAPNMATMLAYIFTDADIAQNALDKALSLCVKDSFNCITVDGCMSTNDTVAMLANGCAGNSRIELHNNFNLFVKALNIVCLELAKSIVKDAEGKTKFIEISVSGAKSSNEAKTAALSVANSNLFKTAVFGENRNFGRIIAAVGSCGLGIKEEEIKVKVSSLKKKEVKVDILLMRGKANATVYTADLTLEYIKINAEYN